MFEQVISLAQQFGLESVVRNYTILNEQNKPVISEASTLFLRISKNGFRRSNRPTHRIISRKQFIR